jgi:hypothetical protein
MADNGAPRVVMAKRGAWSDGSLTMTTLYDPAKSAPMGPLGSQPAGAAQARAAAELAEAVSMMGVHEVAVEIAHKAKQDAGRKGSK